MIRQDAYSEEMAISQIYTGSAYYSWAVSSTVRSSYRHPVGSLMHDSNSNFLIFTSKISKNF